ncbi:hypothetical protein [Paracoccus pacificus]|uniref:Phasin protein n=1 Tax=Paracoccus pacificus TaxID=1463598 RepID=A0ABW4R8F5_9RHOB
MLINVSRRPEAGVFEVGVFTGGMSMKLSDMFASLARNAQSFEKKVAQWQEDLSDRSDELMASAKQWRESAEQRQKDLDQQIKGYFDDASEQVKAQWAKSKADWDKDVDRIKAKAEEMRVAAKDMHEEDVADWSEAYAANMVAYAQQAQEEASKAVAAAAEARAKADSKKA